MLHILTIYPIMMGTLGGTPLHIHWHLLGTQPWPGADDSEGSKMRTFVPEKAQSSVGKVMSTNR